MGETWVRLVWLTNTGNVTQHSFCRRGSVRRRCCRHKLTSLEQCMTIDPHACSLCQHEISEGVRNASDLESRQEHPLAAGWTFVQSGCHFFVSFLQCLIRAGNSWLLRQWPTIILSSISPPCLDYLFILIFSVSSLSKCLAFPWNHPACIVKKGKSNFKRYQSSQSEFATGSRRFSGVLENKSWRVVTHFLWSVKKVETVMLSEG